MSHGQATFLLDRAVLRVTGAEAHKLLQGVITNNLDKAKDGAAIHAGLLTPQGKILFDFFLVAEGDGFLIEAAKDNVAELVKRLGFYKLRAQVEIAEAPEFTVAVAWGGAPNIPEGAVAFADPRLPEMGTRVLLRAGADVAALGCAEAREADYHAMRIKLGVPEGGRDYAFGDTFPHEALFDQLNGVDFKKGCFVGQEVVARMQHRGTTRKRVVPVEGDAPLKSGADIEAAGLPLGPIGSVDGAFGLALLRLDRAEEAAAQGKKLTADGVTITLHCPAFAQFDVPGAVPA
jgi:folate-binding protein YgfZ